MTITPTSNADLTQAKMDLPPHEHTGPQIKSYDRFLSEESKSRKPSPLKALAIKYLGLEGQISFGGGLPHPSTFPVSQMSFTFPYVNRTVVMSTPDQPSDDKLTVVPGAEQPLYVPLSLAMQYSGSAGNPKFLAFVREHVRRQFSIPYSDWEVMSTQGNTDGIDNLLRMLTQRGDNIIVEEFCYPGTLEAMQPMGVKPIPTRLDSEGLSPVHMDEILSNWSTASQGPKPRLVIIVPTGQNPSGTTMSLQRRKDVYKVAQKHDLLIIADEPYRALVLNYEEDGKAAPPAPSFLTIDTDARVVEAHSCSKVIAPGCRTGWLTGPSQLIERAVLRNEVATQANSGFSIAAITSFFGALGSQEAFEQYLSHCALSYSERARRMNRLFKEHLPLEVCEWVLPSAGMFIFVKLRVAAHPRIAELGPDGVLLAVFEEGTRAGVTTAPSTLFKADGSIPSTNDNVFLRCSFSYTNKEEMAEGARRLGEALRISFGL